MNEKSFQQDSAAVRLKIGEWLLYPSLNRLERGKQVIHLEPKTVAVLELLVRREGQPVTRQELLDHVWGNTIVSDDALTQVIIKLRKAFGDDSRKPDYIQTIPKRGYRLLAPVEMIKPSPIITDTGTGYRYAYLGLGLFLMSMVLYLMMQLLSVQNQDRENAVESNSSSVPMTISVLPFEAVGRAQESEVFALGIRSDLITDLSKISGLRVIHVSGSDDNISFSRYVVTGDVQQVGRELKLYVHLLDSDTRQQLWSEKYEIHLEGIFDVQQSISEEIVSQLSVTVTTAEKQRLAKRYTRNLVAYENFLSGQAQLLHRERSSNEKAREWYRLAIENDPQFARAYAGLALSYAADFRNQWVDDGALALKKARDMAETAYQIDPTIPEVYWVLGYVNTQYREHNEALNLLGHAIELDPSYADAYALMGGINTYKGEPDKTLFLLREATRLRPNAGFLYYLLLGRAYFFLGNYEQALINLEETIERNPESLEAHIYLAATTIASGDIDSAQWEVNEIESLSPDFNLSKWLRTYPMSDKEQIEDLTEKLKPIGF